MADALNTTPLTALHKELGAKMVPFAGYEMPVQFPAGVLKEHLHVREKAGLFDVSHMGQAWLRIKDAEPGAADAHGRIARAIESLVPGEIAKLKPGRIRYSVLLNEEGGILDDLMITRHPHADHQGTLFLVVNAAVKARDFETFRARLGSVADLEVMEGAGLLALQGPKAASVLEKHLPEAAAMPFMSMMGAVLDGACVLVSRCGYTGEDGFEISCPGEDAERIARLLLADDDVEPIGLGARDSLRLEAGLCLYGHDMDEATTPVEANLSFTLGKRRREEGGFPGADTILAQHADGPSKLRVGLKPSGRAPAREGAEIRSSDGAVIGKVTSGGFGPSAEGPVAMGYVDANFASAGTNVVLMVRGKELDAEVVEMPIVPHRYYRG